MHFKLIRGLLNTKKGLKWAKTRLICHHNECAIAQLNGFTTNRVWSGQSTPVLQSLTRALLATFKKSVYLYVGFEDQLLIKKRTKKAHGDFYVTPKRRIWLKLKLSSLLNTLIRNP